MATPSALSLRVREVSMVEGVRTGGIQGQDRQGKLQAHVQGGRQQARHMFKAWAQAESSEKRVCMRCLAVHTAK